MTSLLEQAKAGGVDVVLAYRVDPVARTLRGLVDLLEELDGIGVAFRSATEPFDTATASGRMMLRMLGVFAEFKRATIIDRIVAGRNARPLGDSGSPVPVHTATASTGPPVG